MDWDKFKRVFADCELDGNKIILQSRLHEIIAFVKNNYPYDVVKEILGVHKREGRFDPINHVFSTVYQDELLISISVKDEAETITDIFESAIADENEIYDLFGINFKGNKNLKRLYMPEDWQGFPLRKDYVQDDTRLCWNDDNNA